MLSYRERNRKTFQRNLLIGGGALGVGAALLSSSGNRAKLGNMFMSAARFLGSELEQARFGEVGQAFRQSMNSTMAEQNLRDSALGSALRTITRTGEGDALRMARREAAVAMAQHHGFNVADAQILFGEHGTTANIFNMGADKFLGHQFTQNHIFPQLSEEGARLARSKAGMGHLDQIIQNIQEEGVGVNLDLYRAHHSMAINSLEARFAKQGFADRVLSKFGVERHTLGQIVGDGFHEKVASSLGAGNYTLDPRGFMAFKEAVKPATDAERMYVEAAWSHHVAGRPVENLHSIGQLRTDVLSAANNTMINTGPFQNLVSSMGNFLDAHVQIPLMPGKQGLSIFKLKPWDNARARDFSGSIRRGTQLPTLKQGLEAIGQDIEGLFDEQGRLQHDLMYSGDKLLHTGTNQVLRGDWTMMEDYRGFGQKYARVMTSANRNPRGAIRGMLGDTWLGKAFDIIGLDQQSTPSEVSKWYTSFARHLNPEAERYANNPITIFGRITSNPVPGPMDPNQTREIGTILSAVKAHTTLGDKGDIRRILTPELLQGAGVHQGLQDLIAGGLSGEDMATALRELDALTGSSSVVTSHKFFSAPNDRKSFETLRQVARRFAANEADVLSSTRRTGGTNGPFNLEGLLGTTGNLSGEQNLREMFIDAALSQTISGTQDQRTSSMATILANAQKMGEDLHLSVGDVQDLRAGVWARYQHAALYSSEAERERSTQFIRSQLATNKVMQEDVGSVLDKTFGGFRPWTDVAETHTEGVGIYVAPKTEKSALFDWETPWNAAKAIIGQSPEAKANPSFSGWLEGISAVARSVITGTDGSMGWTQGPSEMLATGWRMNDLLGAWGLGLPDKDIQTVGDTAKNLVLKRILPAVGAVEAWKYLNYQTNAWTGTSPAKGMANIRAGASLTSASVFDALGITKLSKSFVDLTPGMENYIRPRDREEQEEYLKNGQDPVRSGRFWLTGSRSPIYGGKIKYFSPSWYQMQTSDWQGAENVDLNSQWYWKHKSLMPNLENPLAPLNIFDPYSWESKHSTGPRADRPYLISGGQASSDNLLGQFWNATAGRILKPQVVMYPEYMSSKTQYFGGDSVGAGGVGGVMVQGGSAQPTVGGYGRSGSLFGEGFDQGNGPIQPDKPEYNVTNPNTPIARFRQIHHLFEKQQGIYGFADDTLKDHLGFNEVSKSAMMASPDQAYGWEDRYWSRDLGGLGGSLAAFTRRFLPHRDRSQTQYDPVPNRFFGSSWIPGDEASINLQRGDPYSALQSGAFRLPGEAYERIHHPKLYQTRASSLGGSVEDIANSMFQIGLPGEEDDTSWGYGKYVTETGEKIHERIQKALESRGLLLSKEQRIYDPVLQATGHYDAVIKMDGQQVVGEIKSMGAKKFDAATAPLDAHRAQLNFYLHNLGLQQGLLVYVDRDNPGRIKTFDMAYDPGLYSETKSKVFAARREVDRLIDTGQRSRYDMYDAVTRAEILLNTEPWADKTHVAVSDAQKQVDDEHDPDFQEKLRRRLQIAKRQASQQSELYQVHNYRFNQATQSHSYTVKDIVGPDTIRVEEGNQLIQLAGVSPSKQKIESWMRQHEELVQGGMSQMDAFFAASGVSPGKRIRVITGADTQPDESSAIRGAVFANGRNLAKTMISQGVAEEDIDDNSAAGVMARYSTGDRMYGRIAEKLTHIDTPLGTKFLSVGSALEMYKRKQIYGTVAGDWTAPMKTFLGPTTEAIASRNPILAALTGAMVGSFFGKSREAKVAFATAGALAGALLSGKRGAQEVITGEKWIPTRVRHRREVEEYYDTLKYVKAKSLEAHYARLGHVNIDQLMDEKRGAIDQVNSRMEELRARKNELLFSGKTPQQTSVEIKHLNDEMRILRQRNKNVKLLEGNAALALYYHREAMKTLYGSKPGDPIQMALAGVPRPERELINGVILHGNKHEKAELYRLLSKREKSVLGVYLGKKRRDLPAKETLQEYFKHHQLPDASWLGWTPSVDLNNARAISAKEEHITPIEMGIYPRNMMDAEVAMEDIPVPVISAKSHDIQNSLTKILSGLGYTNIEVQLDVTASDRQSRSDIRMDLSHDRTGQMMRALSK